MFLSLKEDNKNILSNFCMYVPHKLFVNMIPQLLSVTKTFPCDIHVQRFFSEAKIVFQWKKFDFFF